jgi:hypothetical protein
MMYEEEPKDLEKCEHRICREEEDVNRGEVCDNCYYDLGGYCPFISLWEDCELLTARVAKQTAYMKWYSLKKESLRELNRYPEFIFLKDSGFWSEVGELGGQCECYPGFMKPMEVTRERCCIGYIAHNSNVNR